MYKEINLIGFDNSINKLFEVDEFGLEPYAPLILQSKI